MSVWQLIDYAAAIVLLFMSVGFGLLAGPYYHLIDDSREPGPRQNRQNAILLSVIALLLAMNCALVAA